MSTTQEKPKAAAGATASRSAPLRPHVITAVFTRNFSSYFSNPAGYVFITLFVLVCSWAQFWRPEFFVNNLANLAPLNEWMPYLLLFFIPAITMNAWADERRLGTDELLLTLPASDFEVVLGKFLAAVGIYTVALAFSLSHVVILRFLGTPDYSVLATTYLGYWLMGVLMVAIGLVASLLSSNATVGFILGALFIALPIFANLIAAPFPTSTRRTLEDLSVSAQFRDFGTGVIPLSGVLYFLSLAGTMLFLNVVLLGRRHWAGGERSKDKWLHATIRVAAVLLIVVSLNGIVSAWGIRTDLTAERLYTLSPESMSLLNQIPADKPVYIQAFYSPDVPRDYVETRSNLLGLLRAYEAKGGDRVKLNLVETELYSAAARDAEKRFGIEARRVVTADQARQTSSEIYLGVAFTSGLEQVVVPFFDLGLPIEYELTRSIRVVTKGNRKKVGVLQTDAKLLGGFNFQSMGQNPEWPVVTELKKQYEVSSVSADSPYPGDLDVLLVAQPSSLTQKQIDTLTAYVREGHPTLFFMDPLPLVDPQLAPEVPRQPPGGMMGGGPPPEPKGDLKPLLDLLGVQWPNNEIVWNPYNPHLQLADMPPEVVFIGEGGAGSEAFNPSSPITAGLQEVVLMFGGLLGTTGKTEFTPLLRTDDRGGTLRYDESIRQGMFGMSSINPQRRHFRSGRGYTLAAIIQGKPGTEAPRSPEEAAKKKDEKAPPKTAPMKAIVVADLDLISEQFFEIRRRRIENFDFDNVTFVLNCVDVLAGDEGYITLRKRRPIHRTLDRLEEQTRKFVVRSQDETKAAEEAAKEQLDQAQKRLDEKVEKVRANKEMDERTKDIMLSNLQAVESRKLEVEKAAIEDEKRKKLLESKANKEEEVRGIQNQVRAVAILFPPLPALFLGIGVFLTRLNRENQGANPNRLA